MYISILNIGNRLALFLKIPIEGRPFMDVFFFEKIKREARDGKHTRAVRKGSVQR